MKDKKFITPLMKLDEVNSNGRIYPKAVMEKALAKYQEKIADGKAFGFTIKDFSDFNREGNPSHLVTKIWVEGNQVMSEFKPLSDEDGERLKRAMDRENIDKPEFTACGVGNIDINEDGTHVVKDYEMRSVDYIDDEFKKKAAKDSLDHALETWFDERMRDLKAGQELLPTESKLIAAYKKFINT